MITIVVIPDYPCPKCGSYWGHPDEKLNFPNRSKVALEDGVWWWRCYNPDCSVNYYEPLSNQTSQE